MQLLQTCCCNIDSDLLTTSATFFIVVDFLQVKASDTESVILYQTNCDLGEGEHSDEKQSDIRGKIEFIRYFDLFNSEESQSLGIHCLSLGKEDIVRHPILGYILDKIEGTYTPPDKSFSMFECK